MAAKKKKTKATAGAARGFATVSTASKPRAAEPQPDETPKVEDTAETAPVKLIEGAGTTDAKDDFQALSDLTPADLEKRLEEHELQVLVDKYGDLVRKDVVRHANKLKTDRRVLRMQSEPLNVRAWLSEDVLEEIYSRIEEDAKIEATSDDYRYRRVDTDHNITLLDENLANLWTLQQALMDLQFDQESINGALRHVSNSAILRETTRSNRVTPVILDEAFLWLARHAREEQLPTYNRDGSDLKMASASTLLEIPEAANSTEQVDGSDQKPTGTISRQGSNGSNLPAGAFNAHTRDITDRDGPIVSATVISEEKDAESDSESANESDVDGDDPRAQEKYLRLMQSLHNRRPDLTEFTSGKKKGKGQTKVTSIRDTPRVRRLRAMIAALEDDLLFDKEMAQARWVEQRIELLREEAQRRRHGVHEAPNSKPASKTPAALSAASSAPQSDDEGGMLGLGDLMGTLPSEAIPHLPSTQDGEITIRDFGKWTGTSPRKLLEEACRSRDSGAKVTFAPLNHHGMSKRCAVQVQWSQFPESKATCPFADVDLERSGKQVQLTMVGVSTPDAPQADAYIAVVALFSLFGASNRDEKIYMRLPGVWRDLWTELKDAYKEQTDAVDRTQLKALRELAESSIKNAVEKSNAMQDRIPPAQSAASKDQDPGFKNPRFVEEPDRQPHELMDIWLDKSSTPAFAKMQRFRSQLPMWNYKDDLMDAIDANQVVIICGETGCGKSTQTPSFILEHELSHGRQCKVMCTEPRRISAVSLARRVSQELGEPRNAIDSLRSLVGYAIRLDSKVGNLSRLVYATTGVMMRRLEQDPELNDITHLVIDEVHERTIDSDFLLIVLRRLLPRRPNLKVVLMSATVNSERFSNYFDGAPVFNVPGRTFPVKIRYLEDAVELTKFRPLDNRSHPSRKGYDDALSDEVSPAEGSVGSDLAEYSAATRNVIIEYNEYRVNYDLIMTLLQFLAEPGQYSNYSKAILVFLPGLAEIRRLRDMLAGHKIFDTEFQVHALHSAIATEEQERAFLIPPKGIRKIVLSTNIAETGVTIPDVTCVIDTGTHKEMRYDERRQLSRLTEVFISKANAKQRRGRAGRVQEGLCFHLFTKARHDKLMAPQQTPEMMRLSLQELVLRVKTTNMGAVEDTLAAALDPPLPKNIRRAIDSLIDVKALTIDETLTHLGRQLAKLPLDVFLGKLVLLGSIFGCLDSALTIAAILSHKSPFSAPMTARDQADKARMSFKRGESDLLTVYSAYCSWKFVCKNPGGQEQEFLRKNYLNLQTLIAIEETKGQITNVLVDNGFVQSDNELKASLACLRNPRTRNFLELPKEYTGNDARDVVVDAVLAWSLYPKLLSRDGKGWRNVANNQSVSLASTSVNKRSTIGRYLSFYTMIQSMSKAYNAHDTSMVEEFAVALLCGDADFRFYSGVISIDSNRLRFSLPDWKSLFALKMLRENVKAVMNQRFESPAKQLDGSQEAWLRLWQKIFQTRADGK